MSLSELDLDFWIKNNYNVLLIGHHGIGKTSIILDAFNRNKLKWKYFSASTMDPWVDLIGVPKEVNSNGSNYLELVRPKEFQNDEVEAIFFDEYNRSHKKIRNSVMELIQFKSINGHKFNNLRIVWAAINPKLVDDTNNYDVEELDLAQEDRFHIRINLPYKLDKKYFNKKYGSAKMEGVYEWWEELPQNIKYKVSPRRLDYAMEVYTKLGNLRHVLPEESNVGKLQNYLAQGSYKKQIMKLFKSKNPQEAQQFLSQGNNFENIKNIIDKKDELLSFFLPLSPKEKISAAIISNSKIKSFVCKNSQEYIDILKEIIKSKQNHKLSKELSKVLNLSPNCNLMLNLATYKCEHMEMYTFTRRKFIKELSKSYENIISKYNQISDVINISKYINIYCKHTKKYHTGNIKKVHEICKFIINHVDKSNLLLKTNNNSIKDSVLQYMPDVWNEVVSLL